MKPSLGTMEIFKNNTWNKLCTPNWNEHENILTCMAMGYFENSPYDNAWYNGHNTSNATIRRNCSSLTNCISREKEKLQLCKGIFHVKCLCYASFITAFPFNFSVTTGMSVKLEDTSTQACASPNRERCTKIMTLQTLPIANSDIQRVNFS